MTRVYLASASPQRRRLLRSMGVRFTVVRVAYAERTRRGLSPAQNAVRLAIGKAKAAKKVRGIVIGADTLVAMGGKILGKPRDERHAYRILKSFSGRSQKIYTGVALRDTRSGRIEAFVECSRVTFKKMSERDVRAYLKTGEYRGKAGAFGLQGKGRHLIRSVSGSRSNIIGLPLEKLKRILKRML